MKVSELPRYDEDKDHLIPMGMAAIQTRRPPIWLVVAAILVVCESLMLLAADAPIGLKIIQLAVALLLGLFLLQGSKVAWVVALLGAVVQLATERHPWWALTATAIFIVSLLAPPSARYVWIGALPSRSPRPLGPFSFAPLGLSGKIIALPYIGIARVAQWEDVFQGDAVENAPRRYGVLIWRLGVALVFLLLFGGMIHVWQEGSGRNHLIVDILASITWTGYVVTQLAFIVALAVAGYSYVMRENDD